jgi:UDP-GlcNAc:undecaprenyl-phosphate/decaprenyl-phosphate GlcNAc-1-phosphate transferase
VSVSAVAAGAFAVAVVLTPLMIVVARRSGIVDRPGALKSQKTPVPYLGGVAVLAGTAVGVLSGRPSALVALAAALVLGVADDRFDLPAPARLAGEVAIGAIVVATCPVHLAGALAAILVVVVTVVMINGVNLIDGLDLLAGGVGAVAAVAFAVLLHGSGRLTAVALAAALVGFLVFNRPPARIYLGDGGAYLVGTTLAVLVAEAWGPHRPARFGVAALAVVSVPVAELACAMVRRVRAGTSVMAGDRGHPYDRLVTRGWPRPVASLTYVGIQAVLATGAVLVAYHATFGVAVAYDLATAALLVGLAARAGGLTPDQVGES